MSFLDRFRRRKSQGGTHAQSPPALAMLALQTSTPVSFQRIHQHLLTTSATFPRGELDASEQAAMIPIPGGSVTLGHLPVPIPWGDLEWPVQACWQWPEAREALEKHQAHLIVFARSDRLSRVEVTLLLTQVLAAATGVTDAAGIYNGNASLVIEPEQYSTQAADASPEQLPVFLWIGFHPVPGAAGLSIYTTGMPAFGHLDLEAHDTALSPADLIGRTADIVHYQLSTGARLEDGHTFGATAEERIGVRHRKSRYLGEAVTCQLAL